MALILRVVVIGGLLGSLLVTALGMLVDRWPQLELLNHFRPAVVIGVLALTVLALFTRRRHLMVAAGLVAFANVTLFGFALQGVAAAPSAGDERFVRLITYNMWMFNEKLDDIAQFINAADADIAVVQEVSWQQREKLHALIKPKYPFETGNSDVVIFSRHRARASKHFIAEKFEGWPRRSMILLTTFEIKGVAFDIAGVHLAYPFNPDQQAEDVPKLTEIARDRERPLIVAGDFNLTPWSVKLRRFTQESGLKRYNTFIPTWPMSRLPWPMSRLGPFLAIDNVFASPEFTSIAVEAGPPMGSDHRPLIADIAMAPMRRRNANVTPSANYP